MTTNFDTLESGGINAKLPSRTLNGLLVAYKDSQIDECVKTALKRKLRVRYKSIDTFSNFLAFGTTVGAIYLFKLQSLTHLSCSLILMIPCDQGAIEVIKFLPNSYTDDLLVAIGTSRGSLVVFRLTHKSGEQNTIAYEEVYRAENFTNTSAIKLIEYDQDLLDPSAYFNKLYICDSANRLYVLESDSIYSNPKQTLRLFYTNQLPALIFSVNDSNINQISVHRSQLLISTDETTRYFNEISNQLCIIGRKKRKEGFFGACFFNPNYKPMRVLPVAQQGSQQTVYSSTGSINELENLLIFVARPMFRLWQVNGKREVMFTHQFEPLIRSTPVNQIVELHNEPLAETEDETPDEAANLIKSFRSPTTMDSTLKGNHFQKLITIYSSTLGNLLLSFTQHEIFVVDPINARLIVWHSQESPIVHVTCIENEIFIWSLTECVDQRQQFKLDILVLLAPSQLILELHRLHRYLSLALFVQMFSEQFKRLMALPLSSSSVITTEGGLMRNVVINAWSCIEKKFKAYNMENSCQDFKEIIENIRDESERLKQSLENISDSRFFLTMTTENIERLCSEPYTSLISLEVSIANLHTNHVIHFSKDALNRHKSLANLSQSARNLSKMESATRSNYDMSSNIEQSPIETNARSVSKISTPQILIDANVIVERHFPTVTRKRLENQTKETQLDSVPHQGSGHFFSVRNRDDILKSRCESFISRTVIDLDEENASNSLQKAQILENFQNKSGTMELVQRNDLEVDNIRCSNCKWPQPRSHLKPMHSSQQIQYGWIQENFMTNFEHNIAQIEERAFKHGLWHLLLKCLAFNNKIDDYITCCIILDDVRLLNIEQFISTRRNENEVIDCLLNHLEHKLDFVKSVELSPREGCNTRKEYCFKCKSELKKVLDNVGNEEDCLIEEGEGIEDDEISFNVINLFERFMTRHEKDFKRSIAHLLRHPKLLNNSKIPATFYLKIIASAALDLAMGSNRNSRKQKGFNHKNGG